MEERDMAAVLAHGRIAIGVVSLLAPGQVARTMTGRDGSRGGASLFAGMVGARDVALGLGLQRALDHGAPVRGWLEASALVDGIDAAACLLARHHIRDDRAPRRRWPGGHRRAAQRVAVTAARPTAARVTTTSDATPCEARDVSCTAPEE